MLGSFHQTDLTQRDFFRKGDWIYGQSLLRQKGCRNETNSQIRFHHGKDQVCGSRLNIRLKWRMVIREKLPVEPIGTSMLPQ